MCCLAAVGPVLKHEVKRSLGEPLVAVFGAVGSDPAFAPDGCGVEFCPQRPDRFEPEITLVNVDHCPSLGLIDEELAVLHAVSTRHRATHPHALLFGGGDLVAHALANQLTLEL